MACYKFNNAFFLCCIVVHLFATKLINDQDRCLPGADLKAHLEKLTRVKRVLKTERDFTIPSRTALTDLASAGPSTLGLRWATS